MISVTSKRDFDVCLSKREKRNIKYRQLRAVMLEKRVRTFDAARTWMEACTSRYLGDTLSPSDHRAFETLCTLWKDLEFKPYEPKAFRHPSIPIDSQAYLALRYKNLETLRAAYMNPSTPRNDVYAAFLLGAITKQELDVTPPMLDTAYRRGRGWRRGRARRR